MLFSHRYAIVEQLSLEFYYTSDEDGRLCNSERSERRERRSQASSNDNACIEKKGHVTCTVIHYDFDYFFPGSVIA